MFDLVHERSRVHRFTRLNLLKIVTLLTKKNIFKYLYLFTVSIMIFTHHRYLARCVCETQMPTIMANSKDGQSHRDKYLDTSREI